ncbi:MAG: D-galactonate dehydratase family protein [Armatimonadota bacterium]
MKITDVKVFLTCPGVNYVFVKVFTDQPGLYGVGEGTLAGSEPIVAETLRHLTPLILNRDPRNIEDMWHVLYRQGYWRGGPIFLAALAAIDMALWDIKGKLAGMPVYQLLGGASRSGVTVYRHAHGRDAVECEDGVRGYMEQGYRVIRAQIGGYGGTGVYKTDPPLTPGTPEIQYYEPARYILETPKLFEHLRSKVGMEIELLHDCHEQLDPIHAARLAKSLEPYRLFFLEDPLMPEHRNSWPIVRQASTTPLAIGEIFTNRWDILPLLQNGWIDYLRMKPLHAGGITEMRKLLILAEPYNVRSAFHGAGDVGPIAQSASVSLQMAIHNFGVQEWIVYPEQAYTVATGACRLENGMAFPNEAPGLGMDIDEKEAAKYPYQQRYMPMVRRLDGTAHVY